MTTSQKQQARSTSSVGVEPLDEHEIETFRRLLQGEVFGLLNKLFDEQARADGLTKAALAKKLDKDPAIINRCFAKPSNLRLNTLSDLCLAMDAMPSLHFVRLSESGSIKENWELHSVILSQSNKLALRKFSDQENCYTPSGKTDVSSNAGTTVSGVVEIRSAFQDFKGAESN